MRILICNERFLFRFGVDRVLLMLGSYWKQAGHDVVMMGNKLDSRAVQKCSDRFIRVPEAPDYLHGNDYTYEYVREHWEEWFPDEQPDIALIAGWPFYQCIGFLKEKCGTAIFHDYGAVPVDGMSEPQRITQMELRRQRKENLRYADRIVAISRFLEETQSRQDILDADHEIPTAHVLLGIDHLDLHLWEKDELDIAQKDVISDIEAFKKDGYRIIFQPGRWENGNYKNSSASVDVVKKLAKKNIRHKVLVLSNAEDMKGIEEEFRDCFYCLGFIDDDTMRKAMELSDVGMSPTLWEGFDLPLGEMQYLDRPMFVLNVGAHPEVAVNPYFLCEDMDELGDKVADYLQNGLPYPREAFLEECARFRKDFTWQQCSEKMLAQFRQAIFQSMTVFIDVTNACHDTANSGVMRVTRTLSRYLQKKMNVVFVLWDDSVHRYVLPYDEEVKMLCAYGGPEEDGVVYRSLQGRTRSYLDEVLLQLKDRRKVHLFTETVSHGTLYEAIRLFHGEMIPVAAIFYDAIPVLRPELCAEEVTQNHGKYMLELADCDAVIPIAAHNGCDLERYWRENGVTGTRVCSVGLAAEMSGVRRNQEKRNSAPGKTEILFVSTLEPRKNHIRFLKAFERLLHEHPELEKEVSLHMVGNRYVGNDAIPAFVEDFERRHKNTRWLGVVDDETLRSEYEKCTFTVYPSEIEGFGMPIIESLWYGKPCLCSREGSIGELGGMGGCALTDVLSEESMARTLYRLITDEAYYLALQHEASDRHITTWDEYSDSICSILSECKPGESLQQGCSYPIGIVQAIHDFFAGWDGKRIIVVSNFYPPNFVGGAEIIAHSQMKELSESKKARVVAFSLDITGKRSSGSIHMEDYEGIPVIRISMPGEIFDSDSVNFFNKQINAAFLELCTLFRPDVIHCHNIIGMSLGIIDIAKDLGIKTVVTLHDNWGFCYKNTMLDNEDRLCDHFLSCDGCKRALKRDGIHIPIDVRKSYFRRIFENTDAYISPSRYLADTYLRAGFDFHKMHVIWNGIDADRFSDVKRVESEKIRISVIAHFGKHKGIDTLIKAVGLLERKDIEISLVGSGEEEAHYRDIATECGVLHQLRFWGRVDNREIGNVFAETDIYCLPSRWPENQPVSITEAMACGIPVVASNLGGSRELVLDGKTGLLFEAGNEKDLADKLRRLIDDAELRKTFGRAGRDLISQFSFHKQVSEVNRLYDEIVPRKTASKKIIAVKGNVFPYGIEKVANLDVLHWDWIIRKNGFEDVVSCVLLPGEHLTAGQIRMLKEKRIPLYVPVNDYPYYRNRCDMKALAKEYENNEDLLRKLSTVKERA